MTEAIDPELAPIRRSKPLDLVDAVERYAWHYSDCDAYDYPRGGVFWRDDEQPRASDLDDSSKPCTCGFREILEQLVREERVHDELKRQMEES